MAKSRTVPMCLIQKLDLTFQGENCFARLLKVGDESLESVDLKSGEAYQDPQFGNAYGEALVVVGSLSSKKNSFSLKAKADATGIFELSHDDGVADPYILKPQPKYAASLGAKQAGSGWAVQFDCPEAARKLTKVTSATFGAAHGKHEESDVFMHI